LQKEIENHDNRDALFAVKELLERNTAIRSFTIVEAPTEDNQAFTRKQFNKGGKYFIVDAHRNERVEVH
jgi:hypothetical protein